MGVDGATTAWIRDKEDWADAGEVKSSDGYDRADYRWADVNGKLAPGGHPQSGLCTDTRISGDGRADLILTDPVNGNGQVWYNKGRKDEDGTKFEWDLDPEVYLGSSRGANMHFPNLGGQGRADMVGTNPTLGHVSCLPGGVSGSFLSGTQQTDLLFLLGIGLDLVQQLPGGRRRRANGQPRDPPREPTRAPPRGATPGTPRESTRQPHQPERGWRRRRRGRRRGGEQAR